MLYGSAGDGSSLARSLVPMVDPAERLSAARAPDMQRGADLRCHSIIIDDLMMFKTVATRDLKQPTGAEISVKGAHAGGPTSLSKKACHSLHRSRRGRAALAPGLPGALCGCAK